MARTHLRNPALMMSAALPQIDITPLNYCTSAKGIFDDTTRAQMSEAMTEYAKVSAKKTLALFFHGGLIAKEHGLGNARQLYGPYSADTAPAAPDADRTAETWGNAYPYFFVWESGLMETLQHNLPGIVGEAIFRRIHDIIGDKAASVLKADTARPGPAAMMLRAPTLEVTVPQDAAPELSQADIDEVQHAVEHDPIINAEKRRIAAQARPVHLALTESLDSPTRTVRTSAASLLSPEVVNAVVAEEAQRDHAVTQRLDLFFNPVPFGSLALGAGKVLQRIAWRYAHGRAHNFHNTVMEEIFRQFYVANVGASVWAEMKRETGEAFGSDPNCVGSAMIQELLKLYESGESGRKARITLLGHSTGAVYIGNFLAAMDTALRGKPYAAEIQFDVIFMAGAVRVDVFADTIAKHGHLIRNFRAFGLHEQIEATEILVQLDNPPNSTINAVLAQIYTSSLLYFIAGVLEDNDDDTPVLGMERYFTGASPFGAGSFPVIDTAAKFFAAQPNRLVHSDTSGVVPKPALGLRCGSHHHGGFPAENANGAGGTLESVCYLLRTGAY